MNLQIAKDSSPYGVLDFLAWNHQWNDYFYTQEKILRSVELMKEAGICWVRTDFLWQELEPEKGKFSFSKYDGIVDILRRNNIEVLGILGYNVDWSGKKWFEAADEISFSKYAKATVGHFKERIKHWEIWNEPDNQTYWQPQDGMVRYAQLLKKVYQEIKKEDPQAFVLIGGLTSDIANNLQALYKHGCKNYFDIINIHPFVNPLLTNPLEILRTIYSKTYKIMQDNYDDHKEIWFTEIGCPGVHRPSKWWLGSSPSEEEQAQWVNAVYGEPLTWKQVKKIFWAFFRDTPNHWGDGVDNFGLIRLDFSKKLSYETYKSLAKNG